MMMNLQNIPKKLPIKLRHFFYNLKKQLQTPLYFFGSVQRPDFILYKSDVDVVLFPSNIKSTQFTLSQILKKSKNQFNTMVWTLQNGTLVKGSRMTYIFATSPHTFVSIDFTLFPTSSRTNVINEHIMKTQRLTNYGIVWVLYLIKYLYYYHPSLFPKKIYYKLKQFLLSIAIGLNFDQYAFLSTYIDDIDN